MSYSRKHCLIIYITRLRIYFSFLLLFCMNWNVCIQPGFLFKTNDGINLSDLHSKCDWKFQKLEWTKHHSVLLQSHIGYWFLCVFWHYEQHRLCELSNINFLVSVQNGFFCFLYSGMWVFQMNFDNATGFCMIIRFEFFL